MLIFSFWFKKCIIQVTILCRYVLSFEYINCIHFKLMNHDFTPAWYWSECLALCIKTNFTTKKSTSIRKTCSIDIRKRSNLMENSPGWVRRSIVPGCCYIWSLSVFARMLKFHINFTNVFKCNSTSGIWALLKTSMNTSLRISLKISMKTHVCFNV